MKKAIPFLWLFQLICFVAPLLAQDFSLELRPEPYESYDYTATLEIHATVERHHSSQEPSQTFSSFTTDFVIIPTERVGDRLWKMELEIEDIYVLLEAPNQSLSYHMKKPQRNEYMDEVHAQMKKAFSKPISFRVSHKNELPAPLPFSKVDSILDIPQLSNIPKLFEDFFIPFPEKKWNEGWQVEKKVETEFGKLLLQYDIKPATESPNKKDVITLNITGKIKPLSPNLKLDGGFRSAWRIDRTTAMTLDMKLSYNTIFQYPNITIYHQSTLLIQAKKH